MWQEAGGVGLGPGSVDTEGGSVHAGHGDWSRGAEPDYFRVNIC